MLGARGYSRSGGGGECRACRFWADHHGKRAVVGVWGLERGEREWIRRLDRRRRIHEGVGRLAKEGVCLSWKGEQYECFSLRKGDKAWIKEEHAILGGERLLPPDFTPWRFSARPSHC
jgi:hypothetical protein